MFSPHLLEQLYYCAGLFPEGMLGETIELLGSTTDTDTAIERAGRVMGNAVFRRAAIDLQQMIDNAASDLTLISFAFYKVPDIMRALERALDRGVSLRLIAETPGSGEGKIDFGPMKILDRELLSRSEVYVWPKNKRPVDGRGRYGSLHAKAAVADSEYLLITSANLTEYALSLNMEMGLLLRNIDLARQVKELFDRLILDGVLVAINS